MTPNQQPRLHGECWVMLAFNAADMIDLARAEPVLAKAAGARRHLRPSRRAPSSATTQTASLRITERADPIELGPARTDDAVHMTMYDFGVISVCYRIELDTSPGDLAVFAARAYESAELHRDAASRVTRLVSTLADAADDPVDNPAPAEDYLVLRFPPFDNAEHQQAFFADHAPQLARALRASEWDLSVEEVTDALAARTSYTPHDAVVVDWNAAAVFDTPDDADDALIVLEYANAQLLELRLLDEQLDALLDGAWRIVAPQTPAGRSRSLAKASTSELSRIGALQVDAALAFEATGNALKLLGDQYLARVYQLAARRFRLPDWDHSINRKLAVVENIYEKLNDRRASRRMEVLEWIIIVLITISILMYFLPQH